MKQPIYLFKRSNGIWYVLDRTTSKDIWRSTGTSIKADARKVFIAYRTSRPTISVTVRPSEKNIPQLGEFETEFMEYARQNYAPNSQDIFRRALLYLRQLVGDQPINVISLHTVDQFKTGRLQNRSPVSVNIELRALRTLMATAVRWGYLDRNPLSGLKLISIPEKAPRFLEKEEFNRLFNSICQQWLCNIVLFAIHSGARRSEIVNLKWTNVDLIRRVVSFESDGGFRVKAGKRRSVPLNDEVVTLLNALQAKKTCEHVFSLNGQRIDESLVTHKFGTCVRRIGLREGVKFHSLRATFASWLVRLGVPVYSVSKLLGHSDVTTTQKYYAHLEPDKLHDAVNLISVNQDSG